MQRKDASDSGCDAGEVATLKNEIQDLRAMMVCCVAGEAQEPAQHRSSGYAQPISASRQGASGKSYYICGSADHLKAQCPQAQEMRRVESWIAVFAGQRVLAPSGSQDSSGFLESAVGAPCGSQAEGRRVRWERAVLPEHLLSTRRAEAFKNAKVSLEAALADVQRRVQETMAPATAEAAAAVSGTAASTGRTVPMLSAPGAAALQALSTHPTPPCFPRCRGRGRAPAV